jgi:hypothetical protein
MRRALGRAENTDPPRTGSRVAPVRDRAEGVGHGEPAQPAQEHHEAVRLARARPASRSRRVRAHRRCADGLRQPMGAGRPSTWPSRPRCARACWYSFAGSGSTLIASDRHHPCVVPPARQQGRAAGAAAVVEGRRGPEGRFRPDHRDPSWTTTANAMRCIWKRTLKDLGIKNLRWHDLRHEAASRFFEKGLHPLEVASASPATRA